jgi:hypothetical protein
MELQGLGEEEPGYLPEDHYGGMGPAVRIALVSGHASPLAAIDGVDAGSQNVHVAERAAGLVRRGHAVAVDTRGRPPAGPQPLLLGPGRRGYRSRVSATRQTLGRGPRIERPPRLDAGRCARHWPVPGTPTMTRPGYAVVIPTIGRPGLAQLVATVDGDRRPSSSLTTGAMPPPRWICRRRRRRWSSSVRTGEGQRLRATPGGAMPSGEL